MYDVAKIYISTSNFAGLTQLTGEQSACYYLSKGAELGCGGG
jgi:hypothetical protein